tara:strand:- start:99 stop:365 length:267 start_codon:yes stop_codon:yes gene_type:complete
MMLSKRERDDSKKKTKTRTASPLCPAPKRKRVFAAAFPPHAHATIPVTPIARSDFVLVFEDDGTDVERLDDDDDDDDDDATNRSESSS